MKTVLTSIILFFVSFSLYSQTVLIYDENGNKIHLQEIDSIIQIKFKKNTEKSEKIGVIKMINPDADTSYLNKDRLRIKMKKGSRFTYNDVKNRNSVIYANKSLISKDGTIQIPTDKVLVLIRHDKENTRPKYNPFFLS